MAFFQTDPTQAQSGTQGQQITSNKIVIPTLDINFGDPSGFDPSIAPSLDTMVTMPLFPGSAPQPQGQQPASQAPIQTQQPTYTQPTVQQPYQNQSYPQPEPIQPQLDISFDPIPQPTTQQPPIQQPQPTQPQLDISFDPIPQPAYTEPTVDQHSYQEQSYTQLEPVQTEEQQENASTYDETYTPYQSSQPTDFYTEEPFPQNTDDLDTIVRDLFVTDIDDVTDMMTGIRYIRFKDDDTTIRLAKVHDDGMIEQLIITYIDTRYYYYLGEMTDDNEIMGTEEEGSEVRTLLTEKLRLIRDIFLQESERRYHEQQAQSQRTKQQELLNRLRAF
ncbi:MAG: hypothetical protein NZL83_01025 [Candidatus Absconditabacterales bacterium]|nr:hypothetical protein [Candidatus Absconditabacterales bacterium]